MDTPASPPRVILNSAAPNRRVPHQRTKHRFWHDSIIEWMLANPRGSLVDCAAALGRSPQTLYLITNSDLFRLRYEQRRKEHFESLSQTILERTARVAAKSLEILEERLEDAPEKITTKQILDTANSTLERLGYGASVAPQTNISVNTNPQVAVTVSSDILSDAREKLRRLQDMNASETPEPRRLDASDLAKLLPIDSPAATEVPTADENPE